MPRDAKKRHKANAYGDFLKKRGAKSAAGMAVSSCEYRFLNGGLKLQDKRPRTVPLEYAGVWRAERRMLPPHLRSFDNTRRVNNLKRALNTALYSRITKTQREHLMLFYEKRLSKTQIGDIYGVGSSTVCKTLKAAEKNIKEYVELYMQIYDLLEHEHLCEDNELC